MCLDCIMTKPYERRVFVRSLLDELEEIEEHIKTCDGLSIFRD